MTRTKRLTIDVGCTPFIPADERTYPTSNFVDEENWVQSEYIMLTPEELDEVVITERTIVVLFSYPFDGAFPFLFRTTKKEGFTRKRLIDLISNKYIKMYEDEDTYGIWGHYIGDLVLHTVQSCGRWSRQPKNVQNLLSERGARFVADDTPVFDLGVDS